MANSPNILSENRSETPSPNDFKSDISPTSTNRTLTPDNPIRKRSKVSRACDECRRKKIRCDGGINISNGKNNISIVSDNGVITAVVPCTSCKRANEKCSFTRIPLKRGPSKRSKSDAAMSQPLLLDIHANNGIVGSRMNGDVSAYRRHSVSISELAHTFPASHRYPIQPLESGNRTRLPSIDSLTSKTSVSTAVSTVSSAVHWQPPLSPRTLPHNSGNAYFSKAGSPPGLQYFNGPTSPRNTGIYHGNSPATISQYGNISDRASSDSITSSQSYVNGSQQIRNNHGYIPYHTISKAEDDFNEWDNRCLDCYYQLVHPTLPVLPGSKPRLKARLKQCKDPLVRQSVLNALYGLVAAQVSDEKNSIDYMTKVTQSIPRNASQLDRNSKILCVMATTMCYLQTFSSTWLGSAIGQLYDLMKDVETMTIHSNGTSPTNLDDGEDDKKLVRRITLINGLLARLHASVNQQPCLMPSEVIESGDPSYDEQCFEIAGGVNGKITVQMVKLSLVCIASQYQKQDGSNYQQKLFLMKNELESIWDTSPLLKALFYYTAIVNEREVQGYTSVLLGHSNALLSLLDSPLVSVSPLCNLFITLLQKALYRFQGSDRAQEANRQMESLEGLIWRKFPELRKNSGGLRRLAEAAQFNSASIAAGA